MASLSSSTLESNAARDFETLAQLFREDDTIETISSSFNFRKAEVDMQNQDAVDSFNNPNVLIERTRLQKEYMAKYKLKYKELTARKTFLSLLLSDPGSVTHETNDQYRQHNEQAKSALKEIKEELQETYARIENLAKDIQPRYERVREQIEAGTRLQQEIKDMKLELARLKAARGNTQTIPEMLTLLEERDAELSIIYEKEDTLKKDLANAKVELAQLTAQLERLGPERVKLEMNAKLAKSTNEARAVEIRRLCSWHRSVIDLYSLIFGISTLTAESDNELRISFTTPVPYTLSLVFNPITHRLATAQVIDFDLNIEELAMYAADADDIQGLVRDVMDRMAHIH